MKRAKEFIALNISNLPGWRTSRKIVVIESDDWGTIRMGSKEAYNRLLQKGYPVDKNEYNRYDTLESNTDLERLFDILGSVKDLQGNPGVLTANNIVANPDFEKIAQQQFQQYYYKPFTQTLLDYPAHSRVMDLYREGIKNKLLLPQLHGREHINIHNWMAALQQGNPAARDAFEEKMFSVAKSKGNNCRKEFLDGFGTFSLEAITTFENIITEAADLFETIWGFRSTSVIAPCYTWHPAVEKYFYKAGIKYIQGGRVQKVPVMGTQQVQLKRHFTGQKNEAGQLYIVRNVFFEPFSNTSKDWVNSSVKEIGNAFFWGKPAVISSHRVNYMGTLHEKHREDNLALLKTLLQQIVSRWPDVEFMSTPQLGDVITATHK